MGSQFAIVYDIIIAAVLIFAVFSGCRKGFVSTVVGMAAVFVAFFCALTFSKPAAEWVYSSMVEEPITAAVSDTMDESMGQLTLSGLSDMDYSKVKISGTPVGEITPDYAGTGKVIFELSEVDLTGTGFSDADLSMFGFDGTEDLSAMNGKTAEFTMADINANGLGKLVTAQVIAVKLQNSPSFVSITEYTDTIGNAVPAFFGSTAESINSGEMSAIRSLVLTMINTSSSVKTAVVDNIIRPTFIMMAETFIFSGIFIVVTALLGIIASALKLVNKIPVIGSLNGFLGGCAGFVRGLLTVFIICIIVRFIITMSGGNAMLINDTVIDSTYIFKFFYGFEFLNFLS